MCSHQSTVPVCSSVTVKQAPVHNLNISSQAAQYLACSGAGGLTVFEGSAAVAEARCPDLNLPDRLAMNGKITRPAARFMYTP